MRPKPAKAFEAALKILKARRFTLKDAQYPSGIPYDTATGAIVTAEGAASFENLARSPKLNELVDAGQQAGLLAGLAMPAGGLSSRPAGFGRKPFTP